MAAFATVENYKCKFQHMIQNECACPQLDASKVVVNLSSQALDPAAVSTLARGLNFAQTPTALSVNEFTCGVEKAALRLSEMQDRELRNQVSCILT